MSESLTGNDVVVTASSEPTVQTTTPTTAESSNQETISTPVVNTGNEAVSTDTATQKPQTNSSVNEDDNSLAKFAKSQGYSDEDITSLSDREKKLLKIASDNQKAYRNNTNAPKVADVAKIINAAPDDADVATKAVSEINQFRYEQKTSKFWGDANRDKEFEPAMVEILNEKSTEFGPKSEYVKNLSNDLDTLYAMAQIKSGKFGSPVDEQAIRQEERDSINRSLAAGAPNAHATTNAASSATPTVTREWIQNEYDPKNAEHQKLVNEFYSGQSSR